MSAQQIRQRGPVILGQAVAVASLSRRQLAREQPLDGGQPQAARGAGAEAHLPVATARRPGRHRGYEGMVAKDPRSPYVGGRTLKWLFRAQERGFHKPGKPLRDVAADQPTGPSLGS